MKFERGVLCEKGAVKKKPVFSSTTIAGGKRAFNVGKTAYPIQLSVTLNWPSRSSEPKMYGKSYGRNHYFMAMPRVKP